MKATPRGSRLKTNLLREGCEEVEQKQQTLFCLFSQMLGLSPTGSSLVAFHKGVDSVRLEVDSGRKEAVAVDGGHDLLGCLVDGSSAFRKRHVELEVVCLDFAHQSKFFGAHGLDPCLDFVGGALDEALHFWN